MVRRRVLRKLLQLQLTGRRSPLRTCCQPLTRLLQIQTKIQEQTWDTTTKKMWIIPPLEICLVQSSFIALIQNNWYNSNAEWNAFANLPCVIEVFGNTQFCSSSCSSPIYTLNRKSLKCQIFVRCIESKLKSEPKIFQEVSKYPSTPMEWAPMDQRSRHPALPSLPTMKRTNLQLGLSLRRLRGRK